MKTDNETLGPCLTTGEVCKRLRICRRTLARLRLPRIELSCRKFLYPERWVEKWLAERKASRATK